MLPVQKNALIERVILALHQTMRVVSSLLKFGTTHMSTKDDEGNGSPKETSKKSSKLFWMIVKSS